MIDHNSAASKAMRLILRASRLLDHLNTPLADITLRKTAMMLKLLSRPTSRETCEIAIALMRTALVLLDRDDRHAPARRLQAALDVALELLPAQFADEIDTDLIEAILPPISRP